jgi:hypothetical protein
MLKIFVVDEVMMDICTVEYEPVPRKAEVRY